MDKKFKYQCVNCGAEYNPEKTFYLCPLCSANNTPGQPPLGVLKTIYSLTAQKRANYGNISKPINLFKELKSNNFIGLMPIKSIESLPPLRIGHTPLYKFEKLQERNLNHTLFLKDDSQNPTWSFKDRASAMVSAYASENYLGTIVAASTGNAGSSLAGICAAQGQKAVILVPETAPLAKLSQILMYGATLVPVKGTYDDAFDLSIKASQAFGWYNRNTAYNPLTIEGKKTASFEIFEQMDYSLPDRIFVPVGDGVIISGIYKGFEDLLNLGIINKMPVVVAVQSERSDNLVRNLTESDFRMVGSTTIADSISVNVPRNFYMAREFIRLYHGEAITVSDEDIIASLSFLARNTGLFVEPAAATSFAGYLKYIENHKIEEKSANLLLLTGSGLKDLKSVNKALKMPVSVYPELDSLQKFIVNIPDF